ncbi:Ig-like domain-containing protein [Aquimarina celericrescens]|uniref:Ig-like domain-containing protein n=1 Tax=Aquimarina celericrescens TaxID=1964542 RepID=A0ABW5AST7_9FLAO|nr:Ig-like domain-containing protein [Aquimarina celericrescens]
MRNYSHILLLPLFFAMEVFSQTSPKLIVSKDYLLIKKSEITTGKPLVYRGEISNVEISSATPILGNVVEEKETIRFNPVIPFGWNQKYTLVYDSTIEHFEITLPKKYKYLSVEAIYPSIKKLPSNLLKWYFKFSKPINQPSVYDNIRFTDTNGDTLDRVILPLNNALISDNGLLLTVWVEPGRQKRGLIPNQQLGAVFEEGKEYSLIISKNLKDYEGIAMQQDYIHRFIIVNADREQPTINSWKICIPTPGTTSNLMIHFNEEPMDYGSTLSSIRIIDPQKKEIKGDLKLINNEKTLVFKPLQPWKKGHYQISIDVSLEDLAGNNLNRLFDSDINDIQHGSPDTKEMILEFEVQ